MVYNQRALTWVASLPVLVPKFPLFVRGRTRRRYLQGEMGRQTKDFQSQPHSGEKSGDFFIAPIVGRQVHLALWQVFHSFPLDCRCWIWRYSALEWPVLRIAKETRWSQMKSKLFTWCAIPRQSDCSMDTGSPGSPPWTSLRVTNLDCGIAKARDQRLQAIFFPIYLKRVLWVLTNMTILIPFVSSNIMALPRMPRDGKVAIHALCLAAAIVRVIYIICEAFCALVVKWRVRTF